MKHLDNKRLFDPLLIEVTPRGVSRVRFDGRQALSTRARGGQSALAAVAASQIREYLEGQRTHFDLPLDLESATEFRRSVLEELLNIPFGETVSYRKIADQVGCASPRAVGQAVGWNPLPILVPCHRVVTRNGRLGGYSGGLDLKVALLRLEGITAEGSSFSSPIAIPA